MKKISKINNFCLVRPFLDLNKEDLKNYLLSQNINWIEDESNNDEKYLKNKIRIFLIYTLTNMFTLIVLFRNSNSVAVLIMKKGDV